MAGFSLGAFRLGEAMFPQPVQRTIERHIGALDLCIRAGLICPALILIYVGIDVFGALGRPVGQKRRGQKDFLAWANRYMVKPKRLPVTPLELYGARCGLLHALSAESDLSRDGKVRPVQYAWGNREVEQANATIAEIKKRKPELTAVMIKVEHLADAFTDGLVSFGRDVEATPKLRAALTVRAKKIFGQFEPFPIADQLQP